jgi:hypothetical protein
MSGQQTCLYGTGNDVTIRYEIWGFHGGEDLHVILHGVKSQKIVVFCPIPSANVAVPLMVLPDGMNFLQHGYHPGVRDPRVSEWRNIYWQMEIVVKSGILHVPKHNAMRA